MRQIATKSSSASSTQNNTTHMAWTRPRSSSGNSRDRSRSSSVSPTRAASASASRSRSSSRGRSSSISPTRSALRASSSSHSRPSSAAAAAALSSVSFANGDDERDHDDDRYASSGRRGNGNSRMPPPLSAPPSFPMYANGSGLPSSYTTSTTAVSAQTAAAARHLSHSLDTSFSTYGLTSSVPTSPSRRSVANGGGIISELASSFNGLSTANGDIGNRSATTSPALLRAPYQRASPVRQQQHRNDPGTCSIVSMP